MVKDGQFCFFKHKLRDAPVFDAYYEGAVFKIGIRGDRITVTCVTPGRSRVFSGWTFASSKDNFAKEFDKYIHLLDVKAVISAALLSGGEIAGYWEGCDGL